MKLLQVSLVAPLLIAYVARAQDSEDLGGDDDVDWTEYGDGKDADTGESDGSSSTTSNVVLTSDEAASEDGEISKYRSNQLLGIYDLNMYPYGPLHGDKRCPNTDDAISDPISLPSPLPFFDGGSTSSVRLTSNGLIFLGGSGDVASEPEALPSTISDPFIAMFWNDIWTKKHGRMYYRVDQTNTTLLSELRDDIIAGDASMSAIGPLSYAIVVSFWRVTSFGSKKGTGIPQNTFQSVITTDGTHSFVIFNYQELQWHTSQVGPGTAALAGFDVTDEYYVQADGSLTASVVDLNTASTRSAIPGRHIYRLDDMVPVTEEPTTTEAPTTAETTTASTASTTTASTEESATTALPPFDTVVADTIWESNKDTLGGGIFRYRPSAGADANGTCSITFPNAVAHFHIFNAHIRVDAAAAANTWNFVNANPTFEPGSDGVYSFLVMFQDGMEFDESAIIMSCDADDEFNYAVYSFPQNHLQIDGRSNIRRRDNAWDPTETYSITLGSQVANFTVDDPRISVETVDNQVFMLTGVPDTIQEVWFQFSYLSYFFSNEVGVIGSSD